MAKYEVDDRDRDLAAKVNHMGHTMQPEQVAKLRAVWPDIVKEIGKLEDRLNTKIAVPRSVEDVILAVADKKNAKHWPLLKNIDFSVIPLTDDLRQIFKDLGMDKS